MHSTQKRTKGKLLRRILLIVLIAAILAGTLSFVVFAQNSYVITDGENVTVHRSFSSDPDIVLDEAGISLGAEDTYTLHQIALFGRQSGAAEDTLLLLVQDDRGVEIPAASTDQEFEFVFTVVIAISRDAEISLNLSAEMQSLQLFVEERIQEHDLSPESHKDLRIAAAKMQADIDILQLKIATDVTANPFSVTFESLDGLTVTGVWNADLSRIEF